MAQLIFLSSPYTHADAARRESRYRTVFNCLGKLMQKKLIVYSPIAHCHELGIQFELPFDAAYWEEYNTTMLRRCDGMYILDMEGTAESVGVAEEEDYFDRGNESTMDRFERRIVSRYRLEP